MRVHLVVFEAWNITRFVFTSNKRREVAGASELITYLDRQWIEQALSGMFAEYETNWLIEQKPAELLVTGAGTAKVLLWESSLARALVTAVTSRALREAPGLDVFGWVSDTFEWNNIGAMHRALNLAAAGLERARWSRPGPDNRFLRLPLVDQCVTTGLPASHDVRQPDGSVEARSEESFRKLVAYQGSGCGGGLHRLAQIVGTAYTDLHRVADQLHDAKWIGVIYADGNGLGDIFGKFQTLVEGDTSRAYIDTLRSFTHELHVCARLALEDATHELLDLEVMDRRDGLIPVLPLILGGDDLIALCDGAVALQFAVAFLRAYERRTSTAIAIRQPLDRIGRKLIAASAGVAIVRSHHPFDSAAKLAYELLLTAKKAKGPLGPQVSALAFNVLFDSADVRLDRLHGNRYDNSATTAQPYVVTETNAVREHLWVKGRHWDDLTRRVAALNATNDDGRLLPAEQLERLRHRAADGPDAAAAEFALQRSRYGARGLDELTIDGRIFWTDTDGTAVTALFDSLDVASLWTRHEIANETL